MSLRLACMLVAVAGIVGMVRAQTPATRADTPVPIGSKAKGAGSTALPVLNQQAGTAEAIDFSADTFEYNADRTLVIGRNNVVVIQGPDRFTADYMTVNQNTGEIFARGNVVYTSPGRVWKGEQLTYNFKTKVGRPGRFTFDSFPYHITAEDSELVATNIVQLRNATITTCDGSNPEYRIHLKEGTLTDRKRIDAKGVTIEWNGMPVMWMPRMSRVLTRHDSWFEFMPGYSSRHGAFLLSAYNVHLGDEVLSTTRLDLRSNRGVGFGQDFAWQDESKDLAGHKNEDWAGDISAYYTRDNEPFKDAEEEELFRDVEDENRYRMKFSHRHTLNERDYFIGNLNYLSDPNVLDDFFNDEYRNGVQPENRLTLTHRGDQFTAGIELNQRLNDFYENVNRLPELTLDVNRQELGDTGFYYESQNSAGGLQRQFAEGDTNEDYDAFRLDTKHTIFYPTRHFGFLNLTPRAGYEGTFYSTTYEQKQESVIDIQTDTNGFTTVATNLVTTVEESGGALRNMYELGWDASFKAFKSWDDYIVLDGGDGLRHVAEPYLRHTYIPEPNLRPYELPQFDRIDALDQRHDIQIGMRNKLQTRYNKHLWDIVDANVWTYYRVDKTDPEQEDFDFIYSRTELRLLRSLPIDFNLAYDEYNNEVNQFDTQIAYEMRDASRVGLEYRYRVDGEDFVTPFVDLFPMGKVGLRAELRHDFNLQRLEEQRYFVRYNTSCLSYGLGVRQTDDDIQGWFQIGLVAFPGTHLNLGK